MSDSPLKNQNYIHCDRCDHTCRISRNGHGQCGVYSFDGEKLIYDAYGKLTTICVEPIEKKPFFRFHPGTKTLSFGSYGCNLRCFYCQNHLFSQSFEKKENSRYFSPSDLVDLAQENACVTLCATFTEPVIHYDYIIDVASEAHSRGLYFALKTNAFCYRKYWKHICQESDAINIDWKCHTDKSQDIVGYSGYNIYGNIKYAIERFDYGFLHLELSIPIFPFTEESDIDNLFYGIEYNEWFDSRIPVHLIKIFPSHHMHSNSTPDSLLFSMKDFLEKKYNLEYVYIQNILSE